MTTVITCTLPPELEATLNQFRFRKSQGHAALIFKINATTLTYELEEELPQTTLEDVAESLPDTQPRYVILSYEYKHQDQRVSYPLIFVYWSPLNVKPETHMLYAAAKQGLQQVSGVTKQWDIRDDGCFTDAGMRDKLSFFN